MFEGWKVRMFERLERGDVKGIDIDIESIQEYRIHPRDMLCCSVQRRTSDRGRIHMPISIKNAETEELARELAKETGETITEVIKKSLQDRLQRVRGRRHAKGLPEQVEDILQRMDALPTLDERAEEEILGYDQDGIPASFPKDHHSDGH
jgi:antitoxin VapB